MKTKIAMYKYVGSSGGWLTAWHWDDLHRENEPRPENYVRITEWIEVEFPPLDDDTLVQNQVSAIDAQIASITHEWKCKVDELKSTKASLLALTHKEAV